MRRARGFTLIEVMVALAIVALALASAAIAMSQMASNASSLRDKTYASWIGQNVITELRLSGTLPETDTTSGDVDFAGSNWLWEATVSETGVDNLVRVDVGVFRGGEDYAIRTVTGFVGEPVPPGASAQAWTPRVDRTETRE